MEQPFVTIAMPCRNEVRLIEACIQGAQEQTYNYLAKCVEVLQQTGAHNVGGAACCRARGTVQRAVCAALQSPLGFGGASFRNADAEGWVDRLFPGAFRREVFVEHGRFVGLRPAVPFLTLVGAVSVALVSRRAAGAGLLQYGAAVVVEGLSQAKRFGASLTHTVIAFPTMHLCHAVGFGVGLFRFLLMPDWRR